MGFENFPWYVDLWFAFCSHLEGLVLVTGVWGVWWGRNHWGGTAGLASICQGSKALDGEVLGTLLFLLYWTQARIAFCRLLFCRINLEELLDACVWLLDAEMEGVFQFGFDKQLVYVRAKWTLPDRELLEVAAWTWAWSSNLYDAKVHWLWSSEPANANQVCCCTGSSERLPVYRIRQGSLCEAGTSKQDCLGFVPY